MAMQRQSELRIQALGAAISRRDWHAVEQAHAAIRDDFYAHATPEEMLEVFERFVEASGNMAPVGGEVEYDLALERAKVIISKARG